jgi:hypothetical protein
MKCIEGAPPGIGSEEVIFWYPSSSGGESTHQHAIGEAPRASRVSGNKRELTEITQENSRCRRILPVILVYPLSILMSVPPN